MLSRLNSRLNNLTRLSVSQTLKNTTPFLTALQWEYIVVDCRVFVTNNKHKPFYTYTGMSIN